MGSIEEEILLGAKKIGLMISERAIKQFVLYYQRLVEWNERVNLTAITDADDVARLHFLDCIYLLKVLDFKQTRLLDIGSGAGFPGLPLKIAEPSIDLTLLDAQRKRVDFLELLSAELGMDASFLCVRAEEAAHTPVLRDGFDIVVSRAVARLRELCELCIPFVSVGGVFAAMKGTDSDDEVDEALSAISLLGAELDECVDYTVPGTDVRHRVVLIRKVESTQARFPRRYARIKKDPL